LSTGPALPAEAEDMTVEVRDSSGIPYIQARVTAANADEALAKASSAHPDTEWVFLRELTRDEIAQIPHARPGTADDPAAKGPASARPSPASTAQPSGTGALPSQLEPVA
jgi:hypothetical protein